MITLSCRIKFVVLEYKLQDMTDATITNEFSGVLLPDKRFQLNFESIVSDLQEGIGLSYSRALGERLRKSAWRLFSGDELDLQSGHRRATFARCEQEGVVLAIEDTTDVNYWRHKASKTGLGRLGGPEDAKAYGINIHTSMLVTQSGVPLGICSQKIWSPSEEHKGLRRIKIDLEHKETYKWIVPFAELNALSLKHPHLKIVKICDREADFYELYDYKREAGLNLLIRARYKQRHVIYEGKKQPLSEVLSCLKVVCGGQIKIQRHKDTEERTAKVSYRVAAIDIPRPAEKGKGNILRMNVVHVNEEGGAEDKIEWILFTTLPVHTIEEMLCVVRYYVKRWIIERYHYILKQVMLIEEIQIDDLIRLFNVLQIYAVVAWHLLWLYRLGKSESLSPAQDFFDGGSIEVLESVTQREIKTTADFVTAIAVLAGFQTTKQQPHPGEKTIGQGMIRFFAVLKGFEAAKRKYAPTDKPDG